MQRNKFQTISVGSSRQEGPTDRLISVDTAAKVQENPRRIEYGIIARDNNNEIKQVWAIVEKRARHREVEEVEAIRCAMIKFKEFEHKKSEYLLQEINQQTDQQG
ncbi:hypothetical protein ACH5RR_039211 [Cinchona calisaya]|uniref:Uncharacterized protein n=1 Tax=Cinchona calisaya TaxID=153742 RepID=A0ABD2Y370_9GENT